MVGKRKRSKKQLGNHQKCWLWGRHAVLESLRAGKWLPLEVLFDPDLLSEDLTTELEALAETHAVQLWNEASDRMTQLCGSKEHQGLMAKMPDFPYANFEQLLENLSQTPLILILDRIQDPYNFGSMLRSAAQFGVDAIIVSEHGQSPVSSHVARSSAGAVNYIEIAQVESLPVAAKQLTNAGICILAASEKGTLAISAENLNNAVALVIGNEGEGIQPALLNVCDRLITISQSGRIDSLNAAVAAGVLCYEVQRQRSL